jgi:DNA repair exonuclease SbcCD ATPase subunit
MRGVAQAKLKAAEQQLADVRSEVALYRANSEQQRTLRERAEKELRARETHWQERATKAVCAHSPTPV